MIKFKIKIKGAPWPKFYLENKVTPKIPGREFYFWVKILATASVCPPNQRFSVQTDVTVIYNFILLTNSSSAPKFISNPKLKFVADK